MNFYTCPRLTFLKKNATENAYKRISEPLDFKILWGGGGGGMPPDPPRGLCLQCLNLASSCSGYSPAFGSNNFSLKAKHPWNTRKLCILTDAFKGSFPPCRSGTVASVLDDKPRPKELLFFGT